LYQFDIRDLKGYNKYLPILPNKVFLMINSWPDYDEMGISWKEWLAKVDEYLLKHFPEDYQKADDSIDDITQEEVSGMLGACFSRHSYYLTDRERMIIQNKESYSGMSSRWVKKIFEVRNFDIEDNWLQFEAQAGKRPTQTYKLGSCINPQLDASTGMYQPKLHYLIQDKLKGMFINWFNRKHIGELKIHTQMISKQDPNKQQYFEEHLIIVPNPEFDDEERAQKLSEQRIKPE
jgi:hypothetical protein